MRKALAAVLVSISLSCAGMAFAEESAIKVGAVFSITGSASFLGDPQKKTVEMLVDRVNSAGGINGRRLEVSIQDDESDSTKAINAFRRLVQNEQVVAVIGPSVSGNSISINPLAEEMGIPVVSCAASWKITTKSRETGEGFKWTFKTAQTDTRAVEVIYSHLKARGLSRVAVMSVNTGFGASGREELLRLAPSFGLKVVADERYEPKDNDMSVQLTKIKAAAPQAIVNWSVGPTLAVVMRNYKDLGMSSIPFYQSHGFGSLKNVELAAGAAENIFSPLGPINTMDSLPDSNPVKTIAAEYASEYEKRFGEPVSSFGGHAFDAFNLVVSALKAVGVDSAKIRDFIENTKDYQGLTGKFTFGPNDHVGLDSPDFRIVVVKKGKWVPVD